VETVNAGVAVIGGGVIGASIAYHLARQGVEDILIVDRAEAPGAGSTGRATGGFRAQFATPINIQLSLLARDALLRFESETGVDPGFEQVGYLWLASSDAELDALRAVQRLQHAQGLLEARTLSRDEIREVNPVIADVDLAGATFCPTDGYIKPLEILRGYLEAGERLGVHFLWDAEITGMTVSSANRITRITTAKGSIDAGVVVNAAGPWAAGIASMAGIDLPVSPLRRQAAFTAPCPAIPADMPMTIFVRNGFHVRARDGRALVCWPNPEAPGEPDDLKADPDWIDEVEAMAVAHVPVLRDAPVDRSLCYAGLYEMSPDHHVILGRSPHCENMYLANGSSGHGVMHSPAIGAIIADMITGREPALDVSALRPSRFEEGKPIPFADLL
jgi:sarcosine oxidase, subunit beta